MATRRQAREWALQLLFQVDHNPVENLDQTLDNFWKQQVTAHAEEREDHVHRAAAGDAPGEGKDAAKIQAFTERVVRGVIRNREAIDARLTEYVKNWPLHRMGGIERNVLRMAFYELFFEEDTPPIVCINEAVDLAKYFSHAEAGRFVNGILDRAAREVKRPSRQRQQK